RYLAAALLGPLLGYRFPASLAGDRLVQLGSPLLYERAGRRRPGRVRPGGALLVQLASPLLYEAARRAGLGRFVLDAHNVYQDMTEFPQASLRDRVFYRVTRRRQARMEAACWAAAAHVILCSTVDRARAERPRAGHG